MSIKDRMSENIFQKLNDMKKVLPNYSIFSEEDEEDIQRELLKQADEEEASDVIDDDFFTSLSGPTHEDGNEKLVEVKYKGRIGYVDISFESMEDDLTETEYQDIISSLEKMAYRKIASERKAAAKEVEKYGEKSINVIFRESRKFDLTNRQIKTELVHLLARLTVRSYKGRKLIKALIEKANINQHITLSILGAGAVREQEAVEAILHQMQDSSFFEVGMESLIKIRDPQSVRFLIKIINNLDVNRTDLIDTAINLAPRFNEFGPEAVTEVFLAYRDCTKKAVRPVFVLGLRSFGEDAIPVLSAVLEKETDDNKLVPICMSLGSLKIPFATNLLIEAFKKYPSKRNAIIKGFSHARDKSLLPIIIEELTSTKDSRIKKECLNAISFIGNHEQLSVVKPFLKVRENKLYLDALNCVVSLGDEPSLNKFVDLLINGGEEEQYILQRHLTRMPFNIIKKIAQMMLDWPDDKAILLVSALQSSNILPKEIGTIIRQKLDQKPSSALRLEIYRLIAKYVNTTKELLPQEVLYKAKIEENDPRISRELDQLIKNMRTVEGQFSTIKDDK